MSEAMMTRVRELFESVERNTPLIEERLAETGLSADPKVISSMAKYWDALEKLAAE